MKKILIFILSLFIVSCSDNDERQISKDTGLVSKQENVDWAKIDIPLLDAQVFQSLLDENKGKILFINTWATWCVPCKEEFPDLVRLQQAYENSDVVFIGISVDFEDDIETKVRPFLSSQNVKFRNYVQNFKDPADLINLLNQNWRGAVPATFIYDRQGNQKAFLLGKHSFDEFRLKIESIRNLN